MPRADKKLAATKASDNAGVSDYTLDSTLTALCGRFPTLCDNSGDKKNRNGSHTCTGEVADQEAFLKKWQNDMARVATKGTTAQKWSLIWDVLCSNPDMASDRANWENYKKMLNRCVQVSRPCGTVGPVCSNPSCGKFGHTLAVCPKPTNMAQGDMTGCFFCNVIDHEADDCSMMEWVTPATLVTHLITNRAGMPPWCTRVDWVKLATENWELVDFSMLPLTRAAVKKLYIPNEGWDRFTAGVSSYSDPLFRQADVHLLKHLAADPKKGDPHPRRVALMEASQDLCYCQHQCSTKKTDHAVFKNKALQKYIPNMLMDKELYDQIMDEQDRQLDEFRQQLVKKVPKKVSKERKGRRAMKKEAQAAAAAAAAAAVANTPGADSGGTQTAKGGVPTEPVAARDKIVGHSNSSVATNGKGRAVEKEKYAQEAELELPVSERLLQMRDELTGIFENLRRTVRS